MRVPTACVFLVAAACAAEGGTSTARDASVAGGSSSSSAGTSSGSGSSSGAVSSGAGASTSAGRGIRPCGDVDERGGCDGTVLQFCSVPTNTLVEMDCARDFVPGVEATCGVVSAGYGADCLLPANAACGPVVTEEQRVGGMAAAFCAGEGAGCLVTLGASTACSPVMGACSGAGTCAGNAVVLACREGQALALACSGGACAEGRCVGARGAPCSADPGAVMACADGLACVPADDGGMARCR